MTRIILFALAAIVVFFLSAGAFTLVSMMGPEAMQFGQTIGALFVFVVFLYAVFG